jgi:hypothetical protein
VQVGREWTGIHCQQADLDGCLGGGTLERRERRQYHQQILDHLDFALLD